MQEAKADAGKLEISLTPVQIVRDITEVRMYGTKKYGDPDNWKRVELQRYINAMLRHTLAFWEDPYSVDEESGIPHYKHAECNWAFISEMMKKESPPQAEEEVPFCTEGEVPFSVEMMEYKINDYCKGRRCGDCRIHNLCNECNAEHPDVCRMACEIIDEEKENDG